jgi:hypothetical protein
MPDDHIRPPDDRYDPEDLGRRPFRPADDDRIEPDDRRGRIEPEERQGRRPLRPEWDDDDERRYRMAGPAAWDTFAGGVRCIRAAIVIDLIATLGALGLVFLAASGSSRGLFDLANLGRIVGGLVALVLGFVGLCMLCSVPAQTGLKPLAFVTLGSILAIVLLLCAGFGVAVSSRNRGDESMAVALLGCGGLALLAGYVCHYLLLSGAARHLGDHGLAGGFIAYLLVSIVGTVALVVLFGAVLATALGGAFRPSSSSAREAEGMGMLFGCVGVIYFLGMLIWLLVMLSRLADLCGRRRRDRSFDAF